MQNKELFHCLSFC